MFSLTMYIAVVFSSKLILPISAKDTLRSYDCPNARQSINKCCCLYSPTGLKIKRSQRTLFSYNLRHQYKIMIRTTIYREMSNIKSTKIQEVHVFHLILELSLWNLLKRGVKLRMQMELEQRRQPMLQLHLNDQEFYWPITSRGVTVCGGEKHMNFFVDNT